MLLGVLSLLALALTCTMFAVKSPMLGFPCGIFWALLGGHAYTLSTVVWDIEYLIFFASMGMLIFCIFAAYALRTKKEELVEGDEFIDEGKEDVKFIDENGRTAGGEPDPNSDKPRRRSRDIRDRASRRRLRWE